MRTPLAGHPIPDFDRVADGEDIRVARAHLFVDVDPSAFADLQACHLRQRGIRAHAEGEDHDFGPISLPGFGEDINPTVCGLLEFGHAVIERQADSMLLHVALDNARHFPIERGEDLIQHLYEGHVEPAMHEVFRSLEADEPAPDHYRPGLGPHRLEA